MNLSSRGAERDLQEAQVLSRCSGAVDMKVWTLSGLISISAPPPSLILLSQLVVYLLLSPPFHQCCLNLLFICHIYLEQIVALSKDTEFLDLNQGFSMFL